MWVGALSVGVEAFCGWARGGSGCCKILYSVACRAPDMGHVCIEEGRRSVSATHS